MVETLQALLLHRARCVQLSIERFVVKVLVGSVPVAVCP
jgi:hypothetical protein